MALVTLETYTGEKVNVNADHVQAVTSHQSYDDSIELPIELTFINGSGLREQLHDEDSVKAVHDLRTSERTLVLMSSGTSFEVKGTVDEVLKSLKGK